MPVAALMFATLSLAGAGQASAAEPRACQQADARYELVGHPEYKLGFIEVRRRSGLVNNVLLHIEQKPGRAEVWYYFDEGARAAVGLISTTAEHPADWAQDPDGGARPAGTATFLGLYKDGRLAEASPQSDSPAVDFIIVPELAAVAARQFTGRFDNNAFRLVECGARRRQS